MSLKQEVDNILNELENPDGKGIPTVFYYKWKLEVDDNGKQIPQKKLYVRKHIDKLSVYDNPARDEDIRQFPRQYEAFLNTQKMRDSGTPLYVLPGMNEAQITACEACRIFTIEQLSIADDMVIMDLGDKTLRDRASAFLNGETEKDLQIARLKEKLGELEKDDNTQHSPRRRGRKPAVREADAADRQQQQGSAASA